MTDVGQEEAARMYAAALSGTLTIDPQVARQCATHCEELAQTFRSQIDAVEDAVRQTGFGGFVSARELQTGFAAKSGEARDVLSAYREAALKFQAAFLAAGQLFAEADVANKAALNAIRPGEAR